MMSFKPPNKIITKKYIQTRPTTHDRLVEKLPFIMLTLLEKKKKSKREYIFYDVRKLVKINNTFLCVALLQ